MNMGTVFNGSYLIKRFIYVRGLITWSIIFMECYQSLVVHNWGCRKLCF